MSEKKAHKLLFFTLAEWLVLAFIIIASVMIMLPKVKQASSHRYNEDARSALRETYRELFEKKPVLLASENGLVTSCWLDALHSDGDQPTPVDIQDLISASKTIVTKSQTQVSFFPVALPAAYQTNGFALDQGDPNEYVLALVPIHPATITSRNELMLLDTPVDLSQPQDAIWQKLRDAHRTTNWPDIYLCRRSGELMRLALTDLDKKLPPE
ncbi:hypothetical protein [Lacunimicrobium album]